MTQSPTNKTEIECLRTIVISFREGLVPRLISKLHLAAHNHSRTLKDIQNLQSLMGASRFCSFNLQLFIPRITLFFAYFVHKTQICSSFIIRLGSYGSEVELRGFF